jgi:hypothetical protein
MACKFFTVIGQTLFNVRLNNLGNLLRIAFLIDLICMVINISGTYVFGKTFLCNQIKESFGKKIIVKDLDKLRDDL